MKKIRTLVVDDEPLARARIIHLLQKYDYIQVIGECKNGQEALRKMADYKPDLVFLDIQMPDLNGFDVLAKADKSDLPFIIFVTAYDQYALKAFDVHAVDYLLKPYDDERFSTALEHARKQINLNHNALLHHKMVNLLKHHEDEKSEILSQLEIKEKGRNILLNVYDIYYIESQGNYIQVYTREKSFLIRQTLQSIDEQLAKDTFLRIHRSLLVNTNYLHKGALRRQ